MTPERPPTSDGQVLLQIPAYEVVGTDFEVAFGFQEDVLETVVLRAQAETQDQARAIAQRLTASLRSRYGLEISTKSRREPVLRGVDRKWSYRKASIHLLIVESTVVQLSYRAEATRPAGQL